MARVMLVSSPEKGHVNPLVGVAQWLDAGGHDVGWLGVPEPSPQLRSLPVEVLSAAEAPPAADLVTGGEELARLVRDPERLRAWIRTLLLDGVADRVEPVREVVRRFRPDVVALDGMIYPAVIAARLEQVPFASVSSALTLLEPDGFDSDLLRSVRSLAAERDALFARWGLRESFRTCECLSPWLNVIFATEELVGAEAELPPATVLVGPSRPRGPRGDETSFPWDALDPGRALVYASFGSQISWQPEAYGAIAAAVERLGAQLVLSAGELAGSSWTETLAGDPIVVPYAPQRAILERAAAFVTHGGANSVIEAVSAGVPMLIVPVCNDQPLQAFFATRSGVGRQLALDDLTAARCEDALAGLLDGDGTRDRARRLSEAWARRDGAAEAARRIAELAG